jgi:hypothetical protein
MEDNKKICSRNWDKVCIDVEVTIETEVKIHATSLANKPYLQNSMHSNEWRISETNLVPIPSVICGVKTEQRKLKPIESCDKSVTSYWPVWAGNHIADKLGPNERYVETGLADRTGYACHMGRFLVFHIPAVTFNSQNTSFIPGYRMTLLIWMVG